MKKNIISTIIALSFIPFIASAQTTTYTQAQVATHNTTSDCWIIVSGNVYSVTSYISMHPGGRSAIGNQCGGDATTAFATRGGTGSHSSSARATLNTFLIGSLGAAPAPTVTQPTPVIVTPTPVVTTPTTSTTSTSTVTVNQSYTLCTQTAIRKRDTALVSARSTYNTAMTVALDARTIAETSAVAITDDNARQTALLAAATAYGNQVKLAQDTLKVSRQSILVTYETDIKKCKTNKQIGTTNSASVSKKKGGDSREKGEQESHENSRSTLKSIQDEYKKKVSDIKSFFKSNKSESRERGEGSDD